MLIDPQESILEITWGLRELLETKEPRKERGAGPTLKGWRTAPAFFTPYVVVLKYHFMIVTQERFTSYYG